MHLANLTHEDISFEKEQLKTSSPIPSSTTQTDDTVDETDSEKHDPTYGKQKPSKLSMRPRRASSASRIATQKKIKLTKGYKPVVTQMKGYKPVVTQMKPSPKTAAKKLPSLKPATASVKPDTKIVQTAGENTSKTAGENTSKTSTGTDDSIPLIKVKAKSMTVRHHGLKKHKAPPKGRHCVCDMYGSKFTNSTSFITHYSEMHPALPCKDCSKIFSNPLSLQKHRYHHTGQQLKCGKCNRTFPFDSQLRDHRKTHFKQKPHRCSYPNCEAEATHLYDLKKHERTHLKTQHKCPDCEYTTKDVRYLNQHKKVHSNVNTYKCEKCSKTFRFYMQKKRHHC